MNQMTQLELVAGVVALVGSMLEFGRWRQVHGRHRRPARKTDLRFAVAGLRRMLLSDDE